MMTTTQYVGRFRRDTARARGAASMLWDVLGDLAGDRDEVAALLDRIHDRADDARTREGARRLRFLASEIERIADRVYEEA